MASKHLKRCSITLVIRKMQINMTVRWHFTPTWIARIKRRISTSVGLDEEKMEPSYLWQYKMVQPLWKAVWQYYRKGKKTCIATYKDIYENVHCSIIPNNQTVERVKINKQCMYKILDKQKTDTSTQLRYYLAI